MNRRSFIKITAALGAALACVGSLICAPAKAAARSRGRRTCVWGGRTGEWNDPKMWVDRQVPQDGDDVEFRGGVCEGGQTDCAFHSLAVYEGTVQIGSKLPYRSLL